MDAADRQVADLGTESNAACAEIQRLLPAAVAELDALRDHRARVGFALERSAIRGFTDSRRNLLQRLRIGVLAEQRLIEGALAARVLGALAPPVFADVHGGLEGPVLLTAVALEGIIVAALQEALADPDTAGDTALRVLARASIANHDRTRTALEALLRAGGGHSQQGQRPAYVPSVPPASRPLRRAADVVTQVALLERLAAQVYGSDVASLGEGGCRRLLSRIADLDTQGGVEIDALAARGDAALLGRRAPSPDLFAAAAAATRGTRLGPAG